MSSKEIGSDGKEIYTFDDGTVMYQTSNQLKDLVPGCAYFLIGTDTLSPAGKAAYLARWFYCPEILEDARFIYVRELFKAHENLSLISRVKVLSNTNSTLVLDWLIPNGVETHYYNEDGGGCTVIANSVSMN